MLVLAGGRPLAQSRVTCTSKGREVDIEVNTAIDVRVAAFFMVASVALDGRRGTHSSAEPHRQK